MRPTRAIVLNVVRASMRNRTALFFTLGLAFLFMLIFGLIFSGGGPNVSIGLVDQDHTQLSQRYIDTLNGIKGLNMETGGLDDEQKRLNDDKIAYLVVINPGFQTAAQQHTNASLTAYANQSQQQTSTIAANVVSNVTRAFADASGLGGNQGIVINQSSAATKDITAIDVLLPSMVSYLVLQSGINFVAISLVDQRQRKVLRRFLATPIRPLQILAGNIVGGALTVLLQIAVLVGAGLLIFHAKTHGSWMLASLVILVGTASFVSIGFLLTSAARTSEAARGLAAAVAFPMMFLSGVFIPLDALPQVMQNIVHALPLTYLTEALHAILNDGDGLSAKVMIDIGVLAAWAVGCFTVATMRFRWE
jgi:ABC-2 type transport system permease protein